MQTIFQINVPTIMDHDLLDVDNINQTKINMYTSFCVITLVYIFIFTSTKKNKVCRSKINS